MFRDRIELKDLEKMDAEYRDLLGPTRQRKRSNSPSCNSQRTPPHSGQPKTDGVPGFSSSSIVSISIASISDSFSISSGTGGAASSCTGSSASRTNSEAISRVGKQ